jgi:hypothetical protein
VLVPGDSGSLWLSEGFASYVESHVSEKYGGYAGHVFSPGGNREIDGEALLRLSTEEGQAVLAYIGAQGAPRRIYWDRERVAAPYYVLSQSFVKFLVEKLGLKQILALHRAEDAIAVLAQLTGKNGETWRSEWLAVIQPKRAAVACLSPSA